VTGALLGFSTGAGALVVAALGVDRGSWWLTHLQAHGAAQLFGWAGMFTIGLAWHVLPRFRNVTPLFPWPQRAVLFLLATGTTVRFLAQTMPASPVAQASAFAGAMAIFVAVLCFVAFAGHTLARGARVHDSVEVWLIAGLVWAVVAAGLHLAAMWQLPRNGIAVAPFTLTGAFTQAALFGFLASFTIAISQRAVVGLLGLRPTYRPLAWFAFVTLNAGTILSVAARASGWGVEMLGFGSLLQAAGLIAAVVALRVLEPPAIRRPLPPATYARFGSVIRAAYAWLALGGALLALEGAGRAFGFSTFAFSGASVLHAIALGFITTLIMGMATRMVPMFEGSELPLQRLMDVAIGLHLGGLILRIGFGLFRPAWSDAALGVSGIMGLAGFALFTIPVWRAMRPSARRAYAERMAAMGAERLVEVRRPGRAAREATRGR